MRTELTLDRVVGDVAARYDELLSRLFAKRIEEEQAAPETRVIWSHAKRLRKSGAFGESGIYIWGVETSPIYIGMTAAQTFEERFGRYIWQTHSQCNLATCEGIIDGGISAFPSHVLEWNERNRGTYTPRLHGAVRFARAGLSRVWFALFPIRDPQFVEGLEQLLIPIGNEWNVRNGLLPLENVQGNAPARRRRKGGARHPHGESQVT